MICFLRKLLVVKNKFGRDESKLDSATLLIRALKILLSQRVIPNPKPQNLSQNRNPILNPHQPHVDISYRLKDNTDYRLRQLIFESFQRLKYTPFLVHHAKKQISRRGFLRISNLIEVRIFSIYYSDEDYKILHNTIADVQLFQSQSCFRLQSASASEPESEVGGCTVSLMYKV